MYTNQLLESTQEAIAQNIWELHTENGLSREDAQAAVTIALDSKLSDLEGVINVQHYRTLDKALRYMDKQDPNGFWTEANEDFGIVDWMETIVETLMDWHHDNGGELPGIFHEVAEVIS